MVEEDHIVLFGPPGIGKTTVGLELQKYGYHYYEGDSDLFPEARALNSQGLGLTPELRERQNEYIIQRIIDLARLHKKFVADYDFGWDRHRRRLVELCPDFRWIWLDVKHELLNVRIDRPGHLLTPKFALEVMRAFESPTIQYSVITNNGSLQEVVDKILSQSA